MSLLWTCLCRLTAVLVSCLALASAAAAACTDIATLGADELAPASIGEIQLGLRTAYRDNSPALRDGQFGSYTRQRMQDLCVDVPRPAGLDDVRSTIRLTIQYARLEQALPGWAEQLYTRDLTAGGDVDARRALALRLAATTPMTTLAIGRQATAYTCDDPTSALQQFPAGARALATLTRLFTDKTEAEICALLPVAGGVDAWQQAMDRLGQINGSRIGALQILHSDAFLDWIAAGDEQEPRGTEKRLRRLVGTLPAVLALLDDYTAQQGGTDGATIYSGGPCSPVPAERTLTFYALNAADVADMDFLVSLTPKLDAFRAEAGGFDSPQALWRALRPVLAEDLGDCILDEIEDLVTGPEKLPLTFLIRPGATDALKARTELEQALPVLTDLEPLRTATKAELVNRIKAGLLNVQLEAVGEEVTTAADTLAAASEPAPPQTDTAIVEVETEENADGPPPAPLITATDATDQAVETAIDNPELAQTLRNTPLADATVPELMRAQVRAALGPTAAEQAARTVEDQIVLIEPTVISEWTLSDALQAEILALPFVQATIADATADGLAERLAPLIGTAYPSFRLFQEALETVSGEDGQVPFSKFVTERIVYKAQKDVEDPQVIRDFGPFEVEGCNCVPERQAEDLQVYGFYPFWLAPTPGSSPASTSDTPAEEGTKDVASPAVQQQIDFGTVGQVAFYGLEFTAEGAERVTLRNRDQWRAAKRQFVNSAHQFRARADLAFDLRDWMQWDAATIDEVIEDIATEMAPFERLEGFELGQIRAAIPTLFDPVQPDGVTLIFHDYQGIGLGPAQMKTLIDIVKGVYEALPNRDRLRINVAFDFPVVDERLDQPLFDELFELLVPSPYVLADAERVVDPTRPAPLDRETTKIIHKILLFLERPTTDAKKGLRFRMEQGLFQGETRRQVLRSIIPVVPPGGHELIRTAVKPNAPDQSTPPLFSQFEDDVVYFKDNFSGIGFWPALDPKAAETETINAIIAEHFNAPRLPAVLASFEEPVQRVCTFACPNRAKITLAAMALFALVVLLTWRSFYSGIVDKIAFRFMTIGLVWIGNIVLVATLLVLANCDPQAFWPGLLMWLLVAVLGLLLVYNFVQRIKNGPMP